MKNLLIIVIIFLLFSPVCKALGATSFDVSLGKDGYTYEMINFGNSASGEVSVFVKFSKLVKGKLSDDFDGIRLFTLNLKGKIVDEVDYIDYSKFTKSKINISYIYQNTMNKILLFGGDDSGKSILIIKDKGSNSFINKEIGKKIEIIKVVEVDNKKFIAIGHKNYNFYIACFDYNGNSIWEKDFDYGAKDIFNDALIAGKELIVIGNSGNMELKFFIGDPNIVIFKYDLSGNKISEKTMKGRNGSLAYVDGYLYVAYDKMTNADQNLFLLKVGNDNKNIFNVDLSSSKFNLDNFSLFTYKDCLIVMSSSGLFPVSTIVNKDGEILLKEKKVTGASSFNFKYLVKDGMRLFASHTYTHTKDYFVEGRVHIFGEKAFVEKVPVSK